MKGSEAVRNWLIGLVCLSVFHPAVVLSGQDADSSPAAWSDAEMEAFLLTADIVSSETIGVGSTRPQRAELAGRGVRHDAQIQSVDIFRPGLTQLEAGPPQFNFKDTYKFNIAAYRLDRLIGLDMLPVYVQRRVDGRWASVSWWVDNVQMMELDRIGQGIEPPDVTVWNNQMANARMFTELIYNTDPNLGNILITDDWEIRLVDFSRAFRIFKDLRTPENVGECIDSRVYENLQRLNEEALETAMDDLLSGSEIDGILGRRDKILEIYDRQISQRGEAAVMCDLPWH